MPRKVLTEEQRNEAIVTAEITRRRCILMAAAAGVTQTALADALINREWSERYEGGPLDDLLKDQLVGGKG